MSRSPTPSTSRHASASASATQAVQRPSPVQRLSSDRYNTDYSGTENRWGNDKSLKRAEVPPAGARGVVKTVTSTDERLNNKALHGYITEGTDGQPGEFKGRMPDARVRKQRPVRLLLKRSESGNHGTVLNGQARKALCWPNGGHFGQTYTKVWGSVTEERLTPDRIKARPEA